MHLRRTFIDDLEGPTLGKIKQIMMVVLRHAESTGTFRSAQPSWERQTAGTIMLNTLNTTRVAFPGPWFFCRRHCANVGPQPPRVSFDQAETLAIPESVVLYCARHRFSTDAMEGTGNVMAVMDAMGHGSVNTTRIYTHSNVQQIREASSGGTSCPRSLWKLCKGRPQKWPHSPKATVTGNF